MEAIRKQASKLREQVARQQQVSSAPPPAQHFCPFAPSDASRVYPRDLACCRLPLNGCPMRIAGRAEAVRGRVRGQRVRGRGRGAAAHQAREALHLHARRQGNTPRWFIPSS
jgi:hypothetical protein